MNGFLNIIKPTGMTSNDLVAKIRSKLKKVYGIKVKVGHTGTLDPNASGVMILAFGQSTKFVQYIIEKDKKYIAEILLGVLTDTLDTYGKILDEKEKEYFSKKELHDAIKYYTGTIQQVPPMYSAIKVSGEKLYNIARKGKTIEILPREVTVNNINLLEYNINKILLEVDCSSGTYIRSLARDICEKINNHGILSLLVRTKVDKFEISEAYTLEEIEKLIETKKIETSFIDNEELLYMYDRISISEFGAKLYKNGAKIDISKYTKDEFKKEGLYKVYEKNKFLGLGEIYIENKIFYLKLKTILSEDKCEQ